ncbi:hypothetical protein DIPPA_11309 [Diplonema papillatum]|nr:hypothetical protein DIPPA_11309 [Diplonema papillatum]
MPKDAEDEKKFTTLVGTQFEPWLEITYPGSVGRNRRKQFVKYIQKVYALSDGIDDLTTPELFARTRDADVENRASGWYISALNVFRCFHDEEVTGKTPKGSQQKVIEERDTRRLQLKQEREAQKAKKKGDTGKSKQDTAGGGKREKKEKKEQASKKEKASKSLEASKKRKRGDEEDGGKAAKKSKKPAPRLNGTANGSKAAAHNRPPGMPEAWGVWVHERPPPEDLYRVRPLFLTSANKSDCKLYWKTHVFAYPDWVGFVS